MNNRITFTLAILTIILSFRPAVLGSSQIWIDPNSFDVKIIEGCTTTDTLTIGNDGDTDLNFTIQTRSINNFEPLTGQSGTEASSAMYTPTNEKKIILNYKFEKPNRLTG